MKVFKNKKPTNKTRGIGKYLRRGRSSKRLSLKDRIKTYKSPHQRVQTARNNVKYNFKHKKKFTMIQQPNADLLTKAIRRNKSLCESKPRPKTSRKLPEKLKASKLIPADLITPASLNPSPTGVKKNTFMTKNSSKKIIPLRKSSFNKPKLRKGEVFIKRLPKFRFTKSCKHIPSL
uniref:Uncharacterized protein n=1 Tax=Euplotes crassus TaxID=5936 RepID=A0A7S3NZM6_EUPCR|mmetsp:Transcript_38553/g.38061  ORF Transcript_38553/g.38061 Transcript_38553/m.38061 type:complete len:176 (+) Transcript_38553:732-1259(+)